MIFCITARGTWDGTSARALPGFLPKASAPRADRACDARWLRKALIERKILPCNPGKTARKPLIDFGAGLYKEVSTPPLPSRHF